MSKLIPLLMASTGLGEYDILRIVRNAPHRYKTYTIPKRNGGSRLISQPARELKVLQRILISEILSPLPVHPSAMAYRPGVSLRANAAAHAHNGPILKFDFKDFFPSLTSQDWRNYCTAKNVFNDTDDIWISTNILFQKSRHRSGLRLAIGAPSSPCLSNVLMKDFDAKIAELVGGDSVTYTRYADDMTFSAKRTGFLNGVEKTLRRLIRNTKSPSLELNNEKTVSATKKYKRFVTGLVLTNDGRVSLGRDRKRRIRATLFNALRGRLQVEQQVELAGMLAFVNDIEPDFLARLENRYGSEIIRQLKAARI